MSNEAFQGALSALQAGNIKDAEQLFKEVLRTQPKHLGALNLLGIVLTRLARFAEAETYLQLALQENANSDATLYNYGLVLKALDRPTEALERFTQALAINPAAAETWNNRGTIFNDLKRHEEAIGDFDKAIGLQPRYAEAVCNKGNALATLRRLDDALSAFVRAAELKPDLVEAWLGRGGVLTELQNYDGALAAYDRALALKPNSAEAWLGRGNACARHTMHQDALTAYDSALALKADLAEAWLGRGNVLSNIGQYDEAFAAYDNALAFKPDLAAAWLGRGNVFADLAQYDDAFAAYDRALVLQPDLPEAWFSRGNVYTRLQRYDVAYTSYDTALKLNPDLAYAVGPRLNAKLYMSDWLNLESDVLQFLTLIREDKPTGVPFVTLAVPSSPADQLQCAKRYVRDQPAVSRILRGETYSHDRIRIAYLSNNFHESAMTYLLAGMFEQHDRSRFEVTAVSFGPDRSSPMRHRLKQAFERFVDVGRSDDQEIAELMRRSEIDIAVDLMGFTADNRLNVFARRPAPIQVNYMGYPGTMGADFIDYIVADSTVIPEDERAFYSESVVWLPNSYFINDNRRAMSERTPTRAECGLPESGFVFCCFNSNYKIMPELFDVWMRLLGMLENSVLWLLEAGPTASANLRREAEKRGISPQRLIFAGKTDVADHLARHRLADLCLDTMPCNAHTTASDALWAGLPVVTTLGSSFVARVAASLLKAAGLPDLVTASLEDYEALALKLGRDPGFLASVKDRLARNRDTCPLFDTQRSTRNMEAAYTTMWREHQSGRPPEAFVVPNRD